MHWYVCLTVYWGPRVDPCGPPVWCRTDISPWSQTHDSFPCLLLLMAPLNYHKCGILSFVFWSCWSGMYFDPFCSCVCAIFFIVFALSHFVKWVITRELRGAMQFPTRMPYCLQVFSYFSTGSVQELMLKCASFSASLCSDHRASQCLLVEIVVHGRRVNCHDPIWNKLWTKFSYDPQMIDYSLCSVLGQFAVLSLYNIF